MSTAKKYNNLFYVRDHQVDLIFLIDASSSMNDRIKVPTENGVKIFKKIDVINDMLKKITTVHDCDVMPGTNNFGFESLKTPKIDHVNKVPPWGTNPDGTSMSQEDLESMPIGYLRRFNVKIENQKINIGIIKISSEDDTEIISGLMNYPDNFNRHYLYEKIKNGVGSSKGKDYLHATQLALYEMFFGPRSKQVLKRFLFYIGDAFTPRNKDAIELCNALKPENLLSIRRPLDIDLKGYEIVNKEDKKPLRYNGANKSEWYVQPCSAVSLFAGVGSQAKGVSKKAKEYAFDYEKNPMNPMGYLDISSESSAGQFNRILGIVNVVERLSYDNGFENVFSVTLHNCGPHEVTLLNTIVNFENDTDDTPEEDRSIPYVGATKYTTEFLKSGIPRGNNLFDIETMSPGEDGSIGYGKVEAGFEGDERPGFLVDRDSVENISMAFEATADDDPDDIIGGRNNNFVPGRGGQFYGDPENADLFEDSNSNYNILWHSFNNQYEVYRRGKIYNIDGGWASHWRESKGVKNDGVAFKGMPVRVFKSESTGFEIVDYNIGNATAENGYMGDYGHLPIIERGGEIDLFFGIRVGETLDVSNDLTAYDSLLERVQLFFNSEDKTLNKMACFANVDFNLICPIFRPAKNIFQGGYDLFVPYNDDAQLAPPSDDVDDGTVEMPMAGMWEITFDDAAYVHSTAKIIVNVPAIGDKADGDENKILASAMCDINFDTKDFDIKSLVNALTATITDQASGVTAALTANSTAAKNGYTAPTVTPVPVGKSYSKAMAFYNKTAGEFYLILGARTAASGANPPPPGLMIGGKSINYSAAGTNVPVPDASYSTLQFIFKIDPESEDTAAGDGNDFKAALKSGGHGTWYPVQGTWVDLVTPGVAPTPADPAQGTNWRGSRSKPVTITKI